MTLVHTQRIEVRPWNTVIVVRYFIVGATTWEAFQIMRKEEQNDDRGSRKPVEHILYRYALCVVRIKLLAIACVHSWTSKSVKNTDFQQKHPLRDRTVFHFRFFPFLKNHRMILKIKYSWHFQNILLASSITIS